MTDIVEKLRAEWVADVNSCPQCGADDTDQTDGLMREAADEIERLRAALRQIEYLDRPQVRGLPRRVSIQHTPIKGIWSISQRTST